MEDASQELVFRPTWVKLLAKAFFLSVFTVPIGSFLALCAVSAAFYPPAIDLKFMVMTVALLAIFLIFAIPFGGTVHRLVRPEELRFCVEGISLTARGRTQRHGWSELGEPRVLYSGKGNILGVELAVRHGDGPLRIGAQDYPFAVDDIVRSMREAGQGRLGPMPQEQALALDRYFNLPVTFLSACIFPALAIYLYTR